jgi:hypothetical protein
MTTKGRFGAAFACALKVTLSTKTLVASRSMMCIITGVSAITPSNSLGYKQTSSMACLQPAPA